MRPSLHESMLEIVQVLEKRTTCIRRGVGAVLVNSRGEILSTGFNGVARGEDHCNKIQMVAHNLDIEPYFLSREYPHACEGATLATGQGLGLCKAIHAEQNALLQCSNVYDIRTAYISCTPCIHCIKLLMNTGCELIVAFEEYDREALNLWIKSGNRDYIIFPRANYV